MLAAFTRSTVTQLFVALISLAALTSLVSGPELAQANTDPSCIAKEQAAGPCKTKQFGPTYYAPGCTTQKDKKNTQPKPGYIGAPCKESDGTAFSVGGKCVPGGKCLCETCKADGDKGGMPPMLPMLPMPMPSMGMPMMPMMPPCTPTSRTVTTSSTTDTTPLIRTVVIDGVVTTSTTTRSTTTPVTTTVPSQDCLCQQNPWAPGCEAAGSTGLLNSFNGSGGVFQNTALGALDALGGVANTVGSSIINTAANAIESLTGININTDFTQDTGPTSVTVTPLGTTDTQYAQSTYGSPTAAVPTMTPQYAYDSDTTQYGAFSGQEEDPTFIQQWTQTVLNVLTQLGQALSALFGIL